MHCSIATVDQHLQPTITPIGTLFLHEQGYSGFFFDAYSGVLEENLTANAKACIQAVNSSRFFWLKSLLKGEFQDYPGALICGDWPIASSFGEESARVNAQIKALQWTKGNKKIWSDFTHVRDFKAHGYKWVQYPEMMPKQPDF